MKEILPGVYHWSTLHEHIGSQVSSYYLSGADDQAGRDGGEDGDGDGVGSGREDGGSLSRVLIDPRVPPEGLEWFSDRPPTDVLLSNRHHFRHSREFQRAFGVSVWCHREGLHEFSASQEVRGFEFGQGLPGGVDAVEVAAICPDETALYIPWAGAVSLADGIIRRPYDGPLTFVPDFLMGDDPEAVKQGLFAAFERLLELDFDTLLLAHGAPLVGRGREELAAFVSAHGGARGS